MVSPLEPRAVGAGHHALRNAPEQVERCSSPPACCHHSNGVVDAAVVEDELLRSRCTPRGPRQRTRASAVTAARTSSRVISRMRLPREIPRGCSPRTWSLDADHYMLDVAARHALRRERRLVDGSAAGPTRRSAPCACRRRLNPVAAIARTPSCSSATRRRSCWPRPAQ